MSISAFARTLPTSLTSRTVFVKCTPAPATFTERRAILKALSTTGVDPRIEVFKKLEDNSSFIAVTASTDAATSLVKVSPFERIVYMQGAMETPESSTTTWGAAYRSTITKPIHIADPHSTTTKTSGRGSLGGKAFTIHVFPAESSYNHKRAVASNPLYGPWPDNGGRETFISAALRKSVGTGALAPALRDWDTGLRLSTDAMRSEEEGAQSLLGRSVRGQEHIAKRLRRTELAEKTPEVMKSLAAVAERNAESGAFNKPSGDEKKANEAKKEDEEARPRIFTSLKLLKSLP